MMALRLVPDAQPGDPLAVDQEWRYVLHRLTHLPYGMWRLSEGVHRPRVGHVVMVRPRQVRQGLKELPLQ